MDTHPPAFPALAPQCWAPGGYPGWTCNGAHLWWGAGASARRAPDGEEGGAGPWAPRGAGGGRGARCDTVRRRQCCPPPERERGARGRQRARAGRGASPHPRGRVAGRRAGSAGADRCPQTRQTVRCSVGPASRSSSAPGSGRLPPRPPHTAARPVPGSRSPRCLERAVRGCPLSPEAGLHVSGRPELLTAEPRQPSLSSRSLRWAWGRGGTSKGSGRP